MTVLKGSQADAAEKVAVMEEASAGLVGVVELDSTDSDMSLTSSPPKGA